MNMPKAQVFGYFSPHPPARITLHHRRICHGKGKKRELKWVLFSIALIMSQINWMNVNEKLAKNLSLVCLHRITNYTKAHRVKITCIFFSNEFHEIPFFRHKLRFLLNGSASRTCDCFAFIHNPYIFRIVKLKLTKDFRSVHTKCFWKPKMCVWSHMRRRQQMR